MKKRLRVAGKCTIRRFDIGIWVRNKLRERFEWDDVTLDQEWASLINKAARRYVEGGG